MLIFVSLSFVWDGGSGRSWRIHLDGLVARSTHIIVYITIFIPTRLASSIWLLWAPEAQYIIISNLKKKGHCFIFYRELRKIASSLYTGGTLSWASMPSWYRNCLFSWSSSSRCCSSISMRSVAPIMISSEIFARRHRRRMTTSDPIDSVKPCAVTSMTKLSTMITESNK